MKSFHKLRKGTGKGSMGEVGSLVRIVLIRCIHLCLLTRPFEMHFIVADRMCHRYYLEIKGLCMDVRLLPSTPKMHTPQTIFDLRMTGVFFK